MHGVGILLGIPFLHADIAVFRSLSRRCRTCGASFALTNFQDSVEVNFLLMLVAVSVDQNDLNGAF